MHLGGARRRGRLEITGPRDENYDTTVRLTCRARVRDLRIAAAADLSPRAELQPTARRLRGSRARGAFARDLPHDPNRPPGTHASVAPRGVRERPRDAPLACAAARRVRRGGANEFVVCPKAQRGKPLIRAFRAVERATNGARVAETATRGGAENIFVRRKDFVGTPETTV